MKKTVLILLVAVFSAAIVSAQGLKFGVKAGFNASNFSGFPKIEADFPGFSATSNYRPGFQLGVAAQYMITPQLGLESGLYYSQIGMTQTYKISEGNQYANIKFGANPSYLQLPITVLYKFNLGQDLYLYPQAGLYLGYGLGGKWKTSLDTNVPDLDPDDVDLELPDNMNFFEKINGVEVTNRFDFGATFGLNVQYTNFVIGVGYDLGLGKINKQAPDTGLKDWKNVNIKVTLGYFF